MEDFAAAFPGTDVRPDRYVIDGPVFTCGGAAPAFDLMLHLIRSRLGMAVALDVASVFIYDQSRAATDAQPLVSLGRLDGYDPRLAQAIRLMEAHVDQPLGVAAIARRTGVTARTLEGIFRTSIGETPGAYYLRLRLTAARKLVVDTRVPMADIAARTGFSSAAAFSRAFSRSFGRAADRLARQGMSSGRAALGPVLDQRAHRVGEPRFEPPGNRGVPLRRGFLFPGQRHRHQAVHEGCRFMDAVEQRSDLCVEAALRIGPCAVLFHAPTIAALHDRQKASVCRAGDKTAAPFAKGAAVVERFCGGPSRRPADVRRSG